MLAGLLQVMAGVALVTVREPVELVLAGKLRLPLYAVVILKVWDAVPAGRAKMAAAMQLLTVPEVTASKPATVKVKVPPLTGPLLLVTFPIRIKFWALVLK